MLDDTEINVLYMIHISRMSLRWLDNPDHINACQRLMDKKLCVVNPQEPHGIKLTSEGLAVIKLLSLT